MSVSLYYSLERDTRLTPDEQQRVAAVLARHDLDRFADPLMGGEPFSFWDRPSEGTALEGSVRVPVDLERPEETAEAALAEWGRLLGELRQVLDGGTWRVHLEDVAMVWVEERQVFWFPAGT